MRGLLKIYNDSLTNTSKMVLYYGGKLEHDNFANLDIDDILKYFECGGKKTCIPEEIKNFFSNTPKGKRRIVHVFSVYLLGIYCYDNISGIKLAFDSFITKKIWPNTGEKELNDEKKKRNDFLYLWFLTALFHDMGYLYECEGDNDNSRYSFIIGRKNMMSSANLGFEKAILGIPQKLRYAAKDYFWQRRNNPLFHENLCTDHGFAGGFILFEKLKELHNIEREERQNDVVNHPSNEKKLIFNPLIFKWYNVTCAWTIICHNIWIAFAGSGNADKYEQLGMKDLIFPKGNSPINLRNHPLLFLLDFVDTIDPLKRFCFNEDGNSIDYTFLEKICVENEGSSLSLLFDCGMAEGNTCKCLEKHLERIKSDLSFLESSTFSIERQNRKLVFHFG